MYNLDLWKARKKELHLTLDEIAKKTNISISTIKDIFRGTTYAPRIDTVEAIERALGISSDGITAEERAAGAVETKKISITPLEDEMLYLFREIGKKHGEAAQRALITVAEKML